MRKRCSVLLFSLLALLLAPSAYPQTPLIDLDTASGSPGDVVTLRLSLSTAGLGVIATETTFAYDTAQLTYVSASITGTAQAAGKSVDPSVAGGVLQKLAVYDTGANWNTPIADGDIALVQFRISEGSTPGSTLTISTSNCQYTVAPATTAPATCGSGSVTVSGGANAPVISLGNGSADAGTNVTLALHLLTNGTLPIATETTIGYDTTKLTYVSATAGAAAQAAGKSVDPSIAGGVLQKVAVYATGPSWDTPIADGDLVLITFLVGAGVPPGSQIPVSISGCQYTVAPATTTAVACGSGGIVSVTGGTPARTLSVQSSNPSSGVAIAVSPADKNGQANGTTPFTRTYDHGTQVTLTAPASSGANSFVTWRKDGVDVAGNPVVVAMDANHTLTAVYAPTVPTHVLTVNSSGTATGVSIAVSPADKNGQANGTTPFTRTYDHGTQVTLTAPATHDGAYFLRWIVDGNPAEGNPVGVTLGADRAATAVYAVDLCQVALDADPRGVTIDLSLADVDRLEEGAAPFVRTYPCGATVTVTAPSTAQGRPFQGWQLDGVPVSADASYTLVVAPGRVVTAAYAPNDPFDVTPRSGAAGTTLTITDPTGAFGSRKSAVHLQRVVNGKLTRHNCQVVSWSATRITCKANGVLPFFPFPSPPPAGIYDIRVKPAGRAVPEIVKSARFWVRAPAISAVVPASGRALETIAVHGSHFGSLTGTVRLGGVNCPIVARSWVSTGTVGGDRVSFVIPRYFLTRPGTYTLELRNRTKDLARPVTFRVN